MNVAWTSLDELLLANALICLIHRDNYLLDRQIAGLERQFIEEGGYSERLHAARLQARQKQDRTDSSDRSDQSCPACSKAMVLRTARKGPNAGSHFKGCSGCPECKATLPVQP